MTPRIPRRASMTSAFAFAALLLSAGLTAFASNAQARICHIGADDRARCVPLLGEDVVEDEQVGPRYRAGEGSYCFTGIISLGCVDYD